MRLAPLFLALALSLGACADYIELEEAPIDQPAPAPVPDLPALSLKGPALVTYGEAPIYKAGHNYEAVAYFFEVNGPSTVLSELDDDDDRYFYTEVIGEGQVELRVTAYNARGEAIGFARRWVESNY